MTFQQAIQNANSISKILDIFNRIKELKRNGTINNRKYAEMYQIAWNKYRAILDNDILKIKGELK